MTEQEKAHDDAIQLRLKIELMHDMGIDYKEHLQKEFQIATTKKAPNEDS